MPAPMSLEELKDYAVENDVNLVTENLPKFGGEEPGNPVHVWSWDETRLLVGNGLEDLRIVARSEWQ